MVEMIDLKPVTEIEFQEFMKDKSFEINKMGKATQFLVRKHIVGLIIFNNERIKESKFYLKKEYIL